MAKQWRCAVVGTSTVGQTHVKVIGQIPHAKLVAVCDLVPERAQAALAKNGVTGVPIYKDQAEMLRKEDVDVVHVATPSGLHLGPVMVALEHGKNVICEKPLEIQIDRIDQMIATAARQKVKLACILQNRSNEANRALRRAAEQGRFGTIAWAGCFTPWYRPDQYYQEVSWRGTWKMDGGGAMMNQSIHSIDLLQWIAGPVKTVTAFAGSRIHPTIEAEDTLSCALEFENGAFGTIMGSTAMYPGMPARIEIGGENGTAVSENGLKVFRFRDEHPDDQSLRDRLAPHADAPPDPAAGKGDLHFKLISEVLGAWSEGREAETNGTEARKAVAIILAMYESVRNGGAPVRVKEKRTEPFGHYATFARIPGSENEMIDLHVLALDVSAFRMPFQDNYLLWKIIGFTGIATFGSRFAVQWLYSEKHKESKVPPIFWWQSLVGTVLCLAYALRQKESVFIAGYVFNMVPYTRNLMLINRRKREKQESTLITAAGDKSSAITSSNANSSIAEKA